MQIDGMTYRPITYRGHGMLEKASSFNAQAHVVNHERHHLQQYRAIARATGKEVVDENITIQYKFVDGKLIPVKGEATAVLKEKTQNDDTLELSAIKSQAAPRSEVDNSTKKADQAETKIDQIENRIKSQLEKIRGRISEAESEDDSSMKLAGLKSKERQLEQAASKIDNLRARSDIQSQGSSLTQLLEKVGKALMSPEKLMEAIMGVKTGKSPESNDDSSHAENAKSERAYGSNMDYSLQALAMSTGWVA